MDEIEEQFITEMAAALTKDLGPQYNEEYFATQYNEEYFATKLRLELEFMHRLGYRVTKA